MSPNLTSFRNLATGRKWKRSMLTLTLFWCFVWLLSSTNLVARAPSIFSDPNHGHSNEVELSAEMLKELHSNKRNLEIAFGSDYRDYDDGVQMAINDNVPGKTGAGLVVDYGASKDVDDEKSIGQMNGDSHNEIRIPFVKFRIEVNPNRTYSHKIDPFSQPSKYNIAYIKMIKCASETMTLIFYRFGYLRELSFVLPPAHKLYLGWPYQLQEGFYRPTRDGKYNILCDHAVYNEARFSSVMPNNTVYITSIREPLAQVRSMFNYYNLAHIVGLDKNDPNAFREYMLNLEKYERIYKSNDVNRTRFCIPDDFSMTKNLMSFNLGFPTGWDGTVDESNNTDAIQTWLQHLSQKYDLVMIVEHFLESLILLRRQFSWTWKDILHSVQNVGIYNKTNLYHDPDIAHIYKQWSHVDYILYDHFNKTLWQKISAEGNQFHDEVQAFKDILKVTKEFCDSLPNAPSVKEPNNVDEPKANIHDHVVDPVLHMEGSKWDEGFVVDKTDCTLIGYDHLKFLNQLTLQYNQKNAGLWFEEKDAPKYVC